MGCITPEVQEKLDAFTTGHGVHAEVKNTPTGIFVFIPQLPDNREVSLIFRERHGHPSTCFASINRAGDPSQSSARYFREENVSVEGRRIVVADEENCLVIDLETRPSFYQVMK